MGDLLEEAIRDVARDAAWVLYDTGRFTATRFYREGIGDWGRAMRVLQEAVLGRSGARVRGPEEAMQAALLRDIFGTPFRPATVDPGWLTRNDGAVVRIARALYETRDFSGVRVLADALEEAGCTDDALLMHCRGPGPHVRGCWVIDRILAKDH